MANIMGSKMRRARAAVWLAAATLACLGCSLDSLLKSNELPPTIQDPAVTQTPTGALEMYRGTLAFFQSGFAATGAGAFVPMTGLLTDELQRRDLGFIGNHVFEDERSLPDGYGGSTFGALQKIRGQGGQAIGLLTRYVPEQPALAGQVYALIGYSEVFLAELFCSGIPLSTLDFKGDYTLKPGSTTAEVLQHAVALFDTAGELAADSAQLVYLAAVGKSRALLGLGQYAAAAAAVTGVPDEYRYEVSYVASVVADTSLHPRNFLYQPSDMQFWGFSVADQEGENGLDYITSGDPRTSATLQGTNQFGYPVYRPTKYAADGSGPIVLSSGVEARLIEAEAALQAGDVATWLTKLNALRTAGLVTIPPDTLPDTLGVTGCTANTGNQCGTDGVTGGTFVVPSGYSKADSVWLTPLGATLQQYCLDNSLYAPCANDSTKVYLYVHPGSSSWSAGSGGMAGLAPLADPGTTDARVDLLFRERAFWLFLTGHRQGDLRRLIRQYGRFQANTYPVGSYPGGFVYGGDVTFPVPADEQVNNPLFTGCFSRGA